MKINTDQPFIQDRIKITQTIADFWNQISEGWKMIWGPHIHHGFYEDGKSSTPLEAQENLIEKLTALLKITPQDQILDAGCGMGGSSLFLAKKYHVNVCGITLSQKQVAIAKQTAQLDHIKNVTFKVEDALSLSSFADNSFDLVWSLESCEQFYDKNLFLKQAYRVLKPGGQLMLATWCSSQDEYEGNLAKKYRKLCLAFDLPYMPTMKHYCNLLTTNGFTLKTTLDWSTQVKKSWDVGISLVNGYSFLKILKITGWRGLLFSKQVKLMRDAFHRKNIQYGVFYATKSSFDD